MSEPKYVSFRPAAPAVEIDRASEVRCSWQTLRRSIFDQWYPAISTRDADGQARIDRATDELAARLTVPAFTPEQRRIRSAPEHSEEGWSR